MVEITALGSGNPNSRSQWVNVGPLINPSCLSHSSWRPWDRGWNGQKDRILCRFDFCSCFPMGRC